MTDRERVAEILTAAGTSEDLEKLIKAIEAAANEEAFDLIAGTDPTPSNMVDARALRLRRICETLERELTPREIQVVFRVGESTARSVDNRMRATYPRQMDDIKEARLKAMRKAATVRVEKPAGGDVRYKIHFSQPSARDLAYELLADAGYLKGVERPDGEHLILPLRADKPDGGKINLLTDILGLPDPEKKK